MDIIFFIVGMLVVIGIALGVTSSKKPRQSKKEFYEQQNKEVAHGGGYYARSLLNKSEAEAHKAILSFIYATPSLKGKVKVFSQVSIGEFLGNKDRGLFNAINTKRVDFLITDKYYRPLVVLEMNGTGHRLDEAADLRDSIKQQAIENAGIAFYPIEISNVNEARAATLRILEQHLWG